MAERARATPRRGCPQLRPQRITSIQVLDRSHQLPEGEACPIHQTAHEEAQSYVHAAGNVSLCPFTVSRRSSRSIRRRWEFFPIRCVSMPIKSHDPIHSVYLLAHVSVRQAFLRVTGSYEIENSFARRRSTFGVNESRADTGRAYRTIFGVLLVAREMFHERTATTCVRAHAEPRPKEV